MRRSVFTKFLTVKMELHRGIAVAVLGCLPLLAQADTDLALDESSSPNILYVVPWVEVANKRVKAPKLVVHNLMDDLYEPIIDDATAWPLPQVQAEAATAEVAHSPLAND